MAYDDYDDDDEPRTAEELLGSVRETLTELDERVKKVAENLDDAAASLRMDLAQSRKEMVEVRHALGRLQSRMDNQLLTLVLANVASGIGVAAVVLGATRAFG